jgi:hypothetical protein
VIDRPFGRARLKRVDDIKFYLNGIAWEAICCVYIAHDRAGHSEDINKSSD